MKKNSKKKVIIIISVIVGVIILGGVGMILLRTLTAKPVNVYAVSDLITEVDSEDSTEASGVVRVEGFQSIPVSDTQTISEVYVQQGQHVNAGDPLLAYDTTLTDLDLERAALEVQQLQIQLQNARSKLENINTLVPNQEVLIEPDNSWIKYKPVKTPYKMAGSGTKSDPLYYIVDDTDLFNDDFFKKIVPENTKRLYVVLLIREDNAVNGPIEQSYGLVIYPKKKTFSFRLFEPDIPEDIAKADIPADPYYEEIGSEYTAEEIAEMRREQLMLISDLEVDLQVASLEYEKKQLEHGDNVVRSKEAGVVKAVRDPAAARLENLPVVEISSGGGFFVDIIVGEFELDAVKVGNKVDVTSYNSGETIEGTIAKISSVPVENSGAWSSGNTNVSYYPVTIFISDDAKLTEREYVSVSYLPKEEDDDSFYLENMFILRDKGSPVVYIQNEDGRLEKRNVTTGKSLYGSYLQIKDGLTTEDRIAFPYGKNIKDGAKTEEADIDALYEE